MRTTWIRSWAARKDAGRGGYRAPRPLRHPAGWVPWCALPLLAAFPPLEAWWVAWLALAPLVAALDRSAAREQDAPGAWFLAGWGFGVVFFGLQFAWLHRTLVVLAGLPGWHFAAFMAWLAGGLGLLPAAAFALARWLRLRWGVSAAWSLPVLLTLQDLLLGRAPFGGVAWGSLAGTQPHTLAARLLVPWLGGAGLVLLLTGVNGAWATWANSAWAPSAARGRAVRRWGGAAALAGLTALCAWPAPPPATPPAGSGAPIAVLGVPGDLPLAVLERSDAARVSLRYYLGRTLAALDGEPAPSQAGPPPAVPLPAVPPTGAAAAPLLVVWPESAVRGEVERGKTLVELSRLGGVLGADFLLGSNASEQGRDRNALFLVDGGAFDFRRYDKRRLVPFGEYVPLGFRWVFGRKVTAGENDYAPGTAPPVLAWRGVRLGVAICFESILPAHLRQGNAAGAEAWVVVANDAWLTPAAQRQHLLLTALRGLEAGRDVLFVSNGGWSGHLRAGLLLAGAPPGGAPFRALLQRSGDATPWLRWGPFLLAGAIALVALAGWRRRVPGR